MLLILFNVGHKEIAWICLPNIPLNSGCHSRANEIPCTYGCVVLSIAASAGLGNDHPLVLCGQSCLLEYTTASGEVRHDKRSDWVCEEVTIGLDLHA